jgi:hypothetical protein
MIRHVSVLAFSLSASLLSGCVEPTPNVAYEQLNSACKAGDTQACTTILNQQERQKEAWLRAQQPTGPNPLSIYAETVNRPRAAPPQLQPLGPTSKVCPNGLIVSINYICTP